MKKHEQGIAIVSVLIMAAVLLVVLSAYTTLTLSELRTGKYSLASQQGFYAAEGGLNLRAELVRAKFKGYERPSGTAPAADAPCTGANLGSGDMACLTYTIGNRRVVTYASDITKYTSGSPESGTVEPGDTYAGLNYQQYAYRVYSNAYNVQTGELEATLYMDFQSRLVPLFQFAAFYKDDLEFHPGPVMTLGGRVHTNANLYLNAGATLNINGKTTAVGQIFRKGKDGRGCFGIVMVLNTAMPCNGDNAVTDGLLTPFNNNVLDHQSALTVPPMGNLAPNPTPKSELWSQADLRIVATRLTKQTYVKNSTSYLTPPTFTYQVMNENNTPNLAATVQLNACNTAKSPPLKANAIYDAREAKDVSLVEVDQVAMMDCIKNSNFTAGDGTRLTVDDASGGGLVWNITFRDQNPNDPTTLLNRTINSTTKIVAGIEVSDPQPTDLGVVVRNAAQLGPSSGSTQIKGLTISTNQPIYIQGNFNTVNKKPAAVLADAVNVLSNALNGSPTLITSAAASYKAATATTVNAAFLSGIDLTTGTNYNGGLQNYIRFHEIWKAIPFNYNGSFVSLGTSLHVKGVQNGSGATTRYDAPDRNWNYDAAFNDANNLPPLTPRFVYLRQLLFARTR